jgi:hypothetical protein
MRDVSSARFFAVRSRMRPSSASFAPAETRASHCFAALLASLSCLVGCAVAPRVPVANATHEKTRAAPVVLRAESPQGAEPCLDELLARNVAFLPLSHSHGIATPVQIEGQVAGVRYQPTVGLDLIVDCRFALVLARVGPILRKHGVTTLEYSIAHAYRPRRSGSLSLHANGLALDVHAAVFDDGAVQSVQHDFARRLGARGCALGSKPLNQLACELEHTGWFSEFLTPDYNRDHADHFHIGIARAP